MPELVICSGCEQHVLAGACRCPHCDKVLKRCRGGLLHKTAAAAALGLAACEGQTEGGNVDYGGGDTMAFETGDTGDLPEDTGSEE